MRQFWVSWPLLVLPALAFLVLVKLAIKVTPTMSKWSDKVMYLQGMSACCRVFCHLPRVRNLHFTLLGSLCTLHPDACSNRESALSTNVKSSMVVAYISAINKNFHGQWLYDHTTPQWKMKAYVFLEAVNMVCEHTIYFVQLQVFVHAKVKAYTSFRLGLEFDSNLVNYFQMSKYLSCLK